SSPFFPSSCEHERLPEISPPAALAPPGPKPSPVPPRFDALCPPPRRQQHPLYRTSNQAYGSRAPTVHETTLHVTSHAFSNTLAQCGMYRDNGLNTYLEKSRVTGPDNFITPHDTLNFHPSYNARGPSHC
uniref:Piercer of microtubule wall 1 n=1 Tax=Anas platyrhynchos platyrhynchos TaxID=8840 RepID=A0A493SYR6_ANAPP